MYLQFPTEKIEVVKNEAPSMYHKYIELILNEKAEQFQNEIIEIRNQFPDYMTVSESIIVLYKHHVGHVCEEVRMVYEITSDYDTSIERLIHDFRVDSVGTQNHFSEEKNKIILDLRKNRSEVVSNNKKEEARIQDEANAKRAAEKIEKEELQNEENLKISDWIKRNGSDKLKLANRFISDDKVKLLVDEEWISKNFPDFSTFENDLDNINGVPSISILEKIEAYSEKNSVKGFCVVSESCYCNESCECDQLLELKVETITGNQIWIRE